MDCSVIFLDPQVLVREKDRMRTLFSPTRYFDKKALECLDLLVDRVKNAVIVVIYPFLGCGSSLEELKRAYGFNRYTVIGKIDEKNTDRHDIGKLVNEWIRENKDSIPIQSFVVLAGESVRSRFRYIVQVKEVFSHDDVEAAYEVLGTPLEKLLEPDETKTWLPEIYTDYTAEKRPVMPVRTATAPPTTAPRRPVPERPAPEKPAAPASGWSSYCRIS